MPSALWRIITLCMLLGPLSLYSLSAEAAAPEQRHEPSSKSKRLHSSKISIAPTTLAPAMIQNLRTAVSPDSTRLVLDLDRKTRAQKTSADSR